MKWVSCCKANENARAELGIERWFESIPLPIFSSIYAALDFTLRESSYFNPLQHLAREFKESSRPHVLLFACQGRETYRFLKYK
jgi:hypothetical protein